MQNTNRRQSSRAEGNFNEERQVYGAGNILTSIPSPNRKPSHASKWGLLH